MNTDDIVQMCVEEVLAGKKTPAECAAEFPDIASLEAILAAALALRRVKGLTPRPEAQQKIEARVRARVLQRAENPAARRPRRMPAGLIWAGVFAVIVIVLGAGFGTTAVSSRSVPGEPLYTIKRADESARVLLSPNSTRASVYAGLARRRLDELIVLAERGTLEASVLNTLANDMVSATESALAFVSETPPERQAEVLNTLVLITDEQQSVLTAVKAQAPAEAQAGLDRALEASSQGHEQAVQQLEEVGAPPATTGTPATEGSPTITVTTTLLTETPTVPLATESLTPPGQTQTPPSQTNVPPSQTQTPPGQTTVPPSQTPVLPSQTQAGTQIGATQTTTASATATP